MIGFIIFAALLSIPTIIDVHHAGIAEPDDQCLFYSKMEDPSASPLPQWDWFQQYQKGEQVNYGRLMWEATQAVSGQYPENSDSWIGISDIRLPVWNFHTQYSNNDKVYYQGASYKATTAVIGKTPGMGSEWKKLTDCQLVSDGSSSAWFTAPESKSFLENMNSERVDQIQEPTLFENIISRLDAYQDFSAHTIDIVRFVFGDNNIHLPYSSYHGSTFVEPDYARSAVPGFPFIVGNKGTLLASANIQENRRTVGFGTQFFWVPDKSTQINTLKWLLKLDSNDQPMPAITVAVDGGKYHNELNSLAKDNNFSVRFIDLNKASVADADLVIFTNKMAVESATKLSSELKQYNDIPVLYIHEGWWWYGNTQEPEMIQLLTDVGYKVDRDNYYAHDVADGYTPDSYQTLLDTVELDTPLESWRHFFKMFRNNDFNYDPSQGNSDEYKEEYGKPVEELRKLIEGIDSKGINPFDSEQYTLLKEVVLLGDKKRKSIHYPLNYTADVSQWRSGFFADISVAYARGGNIAQKDLGNFADPVDDKLLKERVTFSVDFAKAGVWQPAGVYAHPGQALTVKLASDAPAGIKVFFNTLREHTPVWSNSGGYNRPHILKSVSIPVAPGQSLTLSTPHGGPVMVVPEGESIPGKTSEVTFNHVGQHLVLNETNVDDFARELDSTPYSWVQVDLPGVQVHSLTSMMRDSVRNYDGDAKKLAQAIIRYLDHGINSLAGFTGNPGVELSSDVLAICQRIGLDCLNSKLHTRNNVQHINVDKYTCAGAGACAGNPYDQIYSLDPKSWLASHEIGHNLQTTPLKIYHDMPGNNTTEVSNQIFPLNTWKLSMLEEGDQHERKTRLETTYAWIQEGQRTSDPIQFMKEKLWTKPDYAAQNNERMTFYTQLAHVSEYLKVLKNGFDIYPLLYMHTRQYQKADKNNWLSERDVLGMSSYSEKPSLGGNDFMLISMSWLLQRDFRPLFAAWGIESSEAALQQVASYNFQSIEKMVFIPEHSHELYPFERTLPIDGVTSWQ